MSTAVACTISPREPQRRSFTFAYVGIFLFFLVYYTRPNEVLVGVGGGLPLAKVAAFLALGGCLLGGLVKSEELVRTIARTSEFRALCFLFAYMWLSIPMSIWAGESFRLMTGAYWKVVVITLAIGVAVNSLSRLKWLLYLCSFAMSVLSVLAVRSYLIGDVGQYGRVTGAVRGLFNNPNELAVNITLIFPFCFAFLLSSRRVFARLFWATCLVSMIFAVMVTYSRTGFLALMAAGLVLMWEFSVKGKRPSLFILVVVLVFVVLMGLAPTGYADRLATILEPEMDETGSALEREYLLQRSVILILDRPLFGVGPGNFDQLSGIWKNPHNTFALLAVEAGIPAMLLFIWVVGGALRSSTRAIRMGAENPPVLVLARAVRACLVTLIVSLLLMDAPYHFYAYFPIGYAVVIARIAERGLSPESRNRLWGRRESGVLPGLN